MQRGQISFDFLVILVFTFLIFAQLFEVFALESASDRILEDKISAVRVGSMVSRVINEVSMVNGTSYLVAIPGSLDTGDAYYLNVTPSGRRVDVFWSLSVPISVQNRSIGVAILTGNVTAFNISKSAGSGQSILNITNINGLINISNIS